MFSEGLLHFCSKYSNYSILNHLVTWSDINNPSYIAVMRDNRVKKNVVVKVSARMIVRVSRYYIYLH